MLLLLLTSLGSNPRNLWFVGLFVALLLWGILGRAAEKKQRAEVFARLGFTETTREQVFDNPPAIADVVDGTGTGSLSRWVARGSSGVGDTVIFEIVRGLQSEANGRRDGYTVIGFRVSAALPSFQIRHALLLDKVVKPVSAKFATATPSTSADPYAQPAWKQLAIENHPEFARQYVVIAADEQAMKPLLTPFLMDTLLAAKGTNLNLRKRADWLFVFRQTSQAASAKHYPELLDEAVRLASAIDPRTASARA